MRLIDKIALTYGMLLTITLLCAAVSLWSATQAEYHLKIAHIAHRTYEAHLRVSNNSFQLFKQFADALLIGDRDNGAGERILIAAIEKDIATIRKLINKESLLVGQPETIELAAISNLEIKINSIIDEYTEYIANHDSPIAPEENERLAYILDRTVDEKFLSHIQAALDRELDEVDANIEENERVMQIFRYLMVIFAATSFLIAISSLFVVLTSIRQPMVDLNTGMRRFAEGNWNYRIKTDARGELGEIADVLNMTAQAAGERELALKEAKNRLEDEVKERTSELRRALLTLEQQNINRQHLLADVSHELRTPLTIIRGEADIALRGEVKKPEEYQEALKSTRKAAEHTTALVNDLLFIARQEADTSRLDIEVHDLVALVHQTLSDMENVFDDRGVIIYCQIEIDKATIRIDKNKIRQVLLILFENACQYGGSEIIVSVQHTPSGFLLSVSDNGPGIKSEDREKIFNRFYRGSNATILYGAGSGLGLPVAKSIVEAHGGQIYVRSELGEGSTFSVELPARELRKFAT